MVDILVGVPLLIVLWAICAMMVYGIYNIITGKDEF